MAHSAAIHTQDHHGTPARPWLRFARHFVEMVIAMVLGMAVLGTAVNLVLWPLGTNLTELPEAVTAAAMTVTMTIPMLAWMHVRQHMARARLVEMTAAMVVPTALAVVPYWLGALPQDAVLVVQHLGMIPAMLAVMLWRREDYSR